MREVPSLAEQAQMEEITRQARPVDYMVTFADGEVLVFLDEKEITGWLRTYTEEHFAGAPRREIVSLWAAQGLARTELSLDLVAENPEMDGWIDQVYAARDGDREYFTYVARVDERVLRDG
jgi:hypothetical protein